MLISFQLTVISLGPIHRKFLWNFNFSASHVKYLLNCPSRKVIVWKILTERETRNGIVSSEGSMIFRWQLYFWV